MEAKNFRNQKFTEKDINKNKAKVLANRYSKLGIVINYYDKYIQSEKDILNILSEGSNILVGCVDNNLARKYMSLAFKASDNIAYIDTGNGDVYRRGQTVFGLKRYDKNSPCVADLFPEIYEEVEVVKTEFKCNEVEKHPQNFATNNMSAAIAFAMITNYITLGITDVNLVTFDTDALQVKGRKVE